MPADQPHRISLTAATAIVVASMVGTGVFTSLGFQLGDIPSGFPIMLLWIVGGVTALCGALCYAELVAMMPRSGGEYHLLGRVFHPLVGFLAGWVSVTAGFPATAALMSMGFGAYVHGIWPQINEVYAALTVLLAFTALRLAGAKTLERFHITLTVLKVVLITGFIGGALFVAKEDWSLLKPKTGDAGRIFSGSFATSLFWVMFAYSGWNGAAYIAGEMHRPQRNVPLALMLGTFIVMLLYVGLNGVMLTAGDWSTMTNSPKVALDAAKHIFGEYGGMWMGALIAFGLLSSVNAMLWSGSSTLSVVGQDSRALCWLDARDRRGELVGAVLFMAVLAVILIFTGSFSSVLQYIQALLELSATATVACVIVLRIKKPDAPRPFRVPFYPLPPLLFICVSAWMLWSQYQMHKMQTLWGLATLVIGALLYLPGVKMRQEEVAPLDVKDLC